MQNRKTVTINCNINFSNYVSAEEIENNSDFKTTGEYIKYYNVQDTFIKQIFESEMHSNFYIFKIDSSKQQVILKNINTLKHFDILH